MTFINHYRYVLCGTPSQLHRHSDCPSRADYSMTLCDRFARVLRAFSITDKYRCPWGSQTLHNRHRNRFTRHSIRNFIVNPSVRSLSLSLDTIRKTLVGLPWIKSSTVHFCSLEQCSLIVLTHLCLFKLTLIHRKRQFHLWTSGK